MTYIEGTLEIMSPSRTHDELKSFGCLVEAWCLERGVEYCEKGRIQVYVKRSARSLRPAGPEDGLAR